MRDVARSAARRSCFASTFNDRILFRHRNPTHKLLKPTMFLAASVCCSHCQGGPVRARASRSVYTSLGVYCLRCNENGCVRRFSPIGAWNAAKIDSQWMLMHSNGVVRLHPGRYIMAWCVDADSSTHKNIVSESWTHASIRPTPCIYRSNCSSTL